jgi:uncharacterized protein (UPF0264 family)
MPCRLLVSVRDTAEAEAALRGGCDWLDIKNPERGPLGRPDTEVVDDIVSLTRLRFPATPVSVALGELREWDQREPSQLAYDWRRFAAIKIGFAGCLHDRNWSDRWTAIARHLECPTIAVAYADSEDCDAPPVEEVLDVAIAVGNLGLLIDTHDKAGPSLTRCISQERLRHLCQRAHAAGLLFSLAGKVETITLAEIVGTGCDVLGVRSAVCEGGNRRKRVIQERVHGLKSSLTACCRR